MSWAHNIILTSNFRHPRSFHLYFPYFLGPTWSVTPKYVFDRVEAVAGSKMCARIFAPCYRDVIFPEKVTLTTSNVPATFHWTRFEEKWKKWDFSNEYGLHFAGSWEIRPKFCTALQDHPRYVSAKYHILDPAASHAFHQILPFRNMHVGGFILIAHNKSLVFSSMVMHDRLQGWKNMNKWTIPPRLKLIFWNWNWVHCIFATGNLVYFESIQRKLLWTA